MNTRTAPLKDNPALSARDRTTLCMWAVREAAAQCGPREFEKFACLCGDFSAPLGAVMACHAEAADGNSPDVEKWQTTTFQTEFPAVMDMTVSEAREWWSREY